MTKEEISKKFKGLQEEICSALEAVDGKSTFKKDVWKREEGGGGQTNIIQKGNIIEKGGVAFSAVHGKTPANILKALELPDLDFYATGVSIVMHPLNPHVPIIHMNIRYFEMENGTYWFGGGIDLTPHYVVKEDAEYFHQQLKNVCDKHDKEYYKAFKTWADDYFFIKHRNETRGIGGIFFDRLTTDRNHTPETRFNFVYDLGSLFAPLYIELIQRNKNKTFEEQEKKWQLLRRGRYVEFNLVYDRGTKFGLDTNGRTESILMSLPPEANWEYDFQTSPGSKEEETLSLLKKNINWVK